MKAVVLCAGYATRLYPLTEEKPKALLLVKGKPILSYIVEKLNRIEGIDNIFIVSNDRFYTHFKLWLEKQDETTKNKTKIVNDETTGNENRLGAIGDLRLIIQKENIDDDILVVLGDNLFDANLNEMADFFKKIRETTVGVYDVKKFEEAKKFGIVKIENGKIISFEEKPENPKSTLSSMGIYIYTKSDLGKIKEYMKTDNSKDGPGHLVKYLMSIKDVYAFQFRERWFDIGSKESYEEVNRIW